VGKPHPQPPLSTIERGKRKAYGEMIFHENQFSYDFVESFESNNDVISMEGVGEAHG
jgi:hypothetical protein